jgi:hypothetical protein
MDLQLSFKPGREQSRAAARYFTSIRKELQHRHTGSLAPREFLFLNDVLPPMRMRVWSTLELTMEALQEIVPWVRRVTGLVDRLSAEPESGMNVEQFVRTAIWPPRVLGTIFMERLYNNDPFTLEADPVVTVGVVNGDTVLLAGSAVSYVALSPRMYGLCVAPTGSFLIEQVQEEE